MKGQAILSAIFFLLPTIYSCNNDAPEPVKKPATVAGGDRLIVCNEGLWQSDNGQLSYFDTENGLLVNQWFRKLNGHKLGDTPNDIVQVNDTLLAIAVNHSNIIQYIHPDGTECGATEDIPNNRRICTDGKYLYVTSYAHRCGKLTFEKGFVAKIDVASKQVIASCATGWEPEGIQLYKGKLYVANTGGYAFSAAEHHDYERTIQVIDAESMTTIKTLDTGCINLAGDMTQAGRYLCLSSGGDYYYVESRSVILDCETEEFTVLDFPAANSTSDGTFFYTIGFDFSFATGNGNIHVHSIDPRSMTVTDQIYNETVTKQILALNAPYELYISPYTGNIYFTDARSYATSGRLYGYSRLGEQLFEPQTVYVNPGCILALTPEQ